MPGQETSGTLYSCSYLPHIKRCVLALSPLHCHFHYPEQVESEKSELEIIHYPSGLSAQTGILIFPWRVSSSRAEIPWIVLHVFWTTRPEREEGSTKMLPMNTWLISGNTKPPPPPYRAWELWGPERYNAHNVRTEMGRTNRFRKGAGQRLWTRQRMSIPPYVVGLPFTPTIGHVGGRWWKLPLNNTWRATGHADWL